VRSRAHGTLRQSLVAHMDWLARSLLMLITAALPGALSDTELEPSRERKQSRASVVADRVVGPDPAPLDKASSPTQTWRDEASQFLAGDYSSASPAPARRLDPSPARSYLQEQAMRRFLTHWRARGLAR
jgi:hypothetical protein